ncbi:MAG: FAD-dependent oxidoreductase, partial [Rhodoglobus sp.]|nr:FAD-dependent oxidoreductase [Rhodoglobus sp.]
MVTVDRDCVIAGGGPAGMMLGYLLARQGLDVLVLEKHADFLRDFRGDTIHPSTISVLGEIGLREEFLTLPLTRIATLDVVVDSHRMTLVDFSTLPPPDDFLALVPQWDFLTLLADHGKRLPGFELRMSTEVTGLLHDENGVAGIRAIGPSGEIQVRARLTVAADGRSSRTRDLAGLVADELGVPIDVLWFDLPKPDPAPPTTLGYLDGTGFVLTIDRGDRYQGGYVIAKGALDDTRAEGFDEFRSAIARCAPPLAAVLPALTSWDQVKLLSVQLNRLPRWYQPGFICIGDAAHAMSPVGGVGINYAIQDAVALANAVVDPLRAGRVPTEVLAA